MHTSFLLENEGVMLLLSSSNTVSQVQLGGVLNVAVCILEIGMLSLHPNAPCTVRSTGLS